MKNIYLAEIDPNTNNKKIINRSPFNSVKEDQNAAKRALRNKKLEKNIYGIIKVDSKGTEIKGIFYKRKKHKRKKITDSEVMALLLGLLLIISLWFIL